MKSNFQVLTPAGIFGITTVMPQKVNRVWKILLPKYSHIRLLLREDAKGQLEVILRENLIEATVEIAEAVDPTAEKIGQQE